MAGCFISFEGGEGSGKTTQIHRLHAGLTAKGASVVVTREPGGCAAAEAIRALLLTGSTDKWHAVAETLLFQAARVEHVERVIRPALEAGKIVLCDRFLDSTLVYQGLGKNLGTDYISALHRLTLGEFAPDLTLIFDIEPETGLARAHRRNDAETRFEHMDIQFHRQVRQGFLTLARAQPERCKIIDAAPSIERITTAVWQTMQPYLDI